MFFEYLIYMKAFKAFIKPFEAPQKCENQNFA